MQNVETLAHLALIARHGADWFRVDRDLARSRARCWSPCWERCASPGCVEIAIGTPIQDLIDLAGGASRPAAGAAARRVLRQLGRAGRRAARLPFSAAGLAGTGAGPGAGLVAALPADACGLAETARVVRYLADESAGQCGACVFGLAAVAGELDRIVQGGTADLSTLHRWLGQVDGRGACSLPDGAVRLIRSALSVFEDELDQHARGRCCATATAPVLPVPPGGT